MCHEISNFMISYPAMCVGDMFHMSRKGGTGGGGGYNLTMCSKDVLNCAFT